MADIHFAPSVALRVAECFDKIRVNPGNFGTLLDTHAFVTSCFRGFTYYFSLIRFFISADRRAQFEELEYTDDEYQKELEHIEKVR